MIGLDVEVSGRKLGHSECALYLSMHFCVSDVRKNSLLCTAMKSPEASIKL